MNAKLYVVNVEAAIYKDDKWLMGKRSETEDHAPGELALIGGKIETTGIENHILEKALTREVMEELTSVDWVTLDEILSDEKVPIYTKESLRMAEAIRKTID